MAKTLSRFYLLKKDENKDKATLFVRVQDPIRKIDVQFTTRLRVSVPEWKVAVSSEDALARHRKEYPKLHDNSVALRLCSSAKWRLRNLTAKR